MHANSSNKIPKVLRFLSSNAKVRSTVLALVLSSLGACASNSSNVWSSVPKLPSASPVVFRQATGKLAFAPISVVLPERRSIGTQSRNVGCWVFVRQLTEADFPPGETLIVPAIQALSAAHLTVTQDPSGDVSGAQSSDYLLTANIAGVHADMCNNTFLENGPNEIDVQVDVGWKLWSVRENRIVFETSTSGIGHSANKDQNLGSAAGQAMADAMTRLLQIATMQQYLTFGHLALPEPLAIYQQQNTAVVAPQSNMDISGSAVATMPALPLIIVPVETSSDDQRPLAARLTDARVSIKAGDKQGNGTLFSRQGYVLTTDTVVGSAETVSVTLSSGQEAPAEIIRRDVLNDLVLLKITPIGLPVFPVEPRRQTVGTQIYTMDAMLRLSRTAIVPSSAKDGTSLLSIGNSAPGLPVVDAEGGLLGLIIGHAAQHTTMMPIATAFLDLHLGVIFAE